MTTTASTPTITFLGASNGVGLSALKHTLAAGYRCIALCRTPAKLTALVPDAENLQVIQGDAKNPADLEKCLVKPDGKTLVDAVISTIGARPQLAKWGGLEDPVVCRVGMTALVDTLAKLRGDGSGGGMTGNPHIVAGSTTGLSKHGRDTPLVLAPLYHVLLKEPHEDKRAMEDILMASGNPWTVVRASLLVDGETDRPVRVGIEDDQTRDSVAIGYTISREDEGKWIADNLVLRREAQYVNKIVTVTW